MSMKQTLQKGIALTLALTLGASTGFAVIPVTDAGVMAIMTKNNVLQIGTMKAIGTSEVTTMKALHAQMTALQKGFNAKEIFQMIRMIDQAKNQFDQHMRVVDTMAGGWRNPVQMINGRNMSRPVNVVDDIRNMGWNGTLSQKVSNVLRSADMADKQIDKVRNGKLDTSGKLDGVQTLRETYEAQYGAISANANAGSQVNRLYKVMAETDVLSGQVSTALQDAAKDIDRLAGELAQGGKSPEEVNRINAQISALRAYQTNLGLKIQEQQNRLMVAQIGQMAKGINDRDRKEALERLQASRFLTISRPTAGVSIKPAAGEN